MTERRIRGVRIIHERYTPARGVVGHLKYSIDVYGAGDNLIEVLGRLADLDAARAAFKECCEE
jgi:hypothetical protein